MSAENRSQAPAEPRSPKSPRRDRLERRLVLGFFGTAVAVGGCMFCYKLFSFLRTIKKDELAGFAYDPILIYGFVAAGFLCLLAWAFLTGQFRDIEGIKHEMLERFYEQERAENPPKDVSTGRDRS